MTSMLTITEWFGSMPVFERIYWAIAIFFTLLFLVQNVLSLFGGDTDTGSATGDVDDMLSADDGIGFQFFTIRNLFGFFTIFGWTGLAGIHAELSPTLIIILSAVAGILMMVLMATLFFYTSKLAYDGTLKMDNTINAVATVYLTIPSSRSGMGKVNLKVQGAFRELDAMTDDVEDLRTGALVTVKQVLNNQILLVTKQTL